MRKKKIAIIGVKGLPGYGGSARANDHILTRLTDKYDFTVYALDSHAKENSYNGLKQHIFRSYKNKSLSTFTYYVKAVLHVMFIKQYDLVHLNHRVTGIFVPILKLRYKVISSMRGFGYDQGRQVRVHRSYSKDTFSYKKVLQIISFKWSDMITTVQRSSVEYIKSHTDKPVYYIPNGVEDNIQKFKSVEKKDIITFSAARVIPLKGGHELLKASQTLGLVEKIKIIGDTDIISSYKTELNELSKGLNVEFTGLVKDSDSLFRILSESSLFVFPSHTEGMSNMLLEVASLGVPILASDIQPNMDVFSDEEVTFFKVGDVVDLANKLRFCLSNLDVINDKAEKALEKVRNDHNWDNISNAYDNCYKTLLNGSGY